MKGTIAAEESAAAATAASKTIASESWCDICTQRGAVTKNEIRMPNGFKHFSIQPSARKVNITRWDNPMLKHAKWAQTICRPRSMNVANSRSQQDCERLPYNRKNCSDKREKESEQRESNERATHTFSSRTQEIRSKCKDCFHGRQYVATDRMTSSIRIYFDQVFEPNLLDSGANLYVEKPTAFAAFPAEIGVQPRRILAHYYNMIRFTVMPHGGHFAALEQPQLLGERRLDAWN